MSGPAAIFQWAWSRSEAGESMFSAETAEVREELLLAMGLRQEAEAIPEPDWDAEWLALTEQIESFGGPSLAAEERDRMAGAEVHVLQGRAIVEADPARPSAPQPVRALIAATLALMILAGASVGIAGASSGSLLYPVKRALGFVPEPRLSSPTEAARQWLRSEEMAELRLVALVSALHNGRWDVALAVASDLVQTRREAAQTGADLTALDRAIAREVPPVLQRAPSGVRTMLAAILHGLLPTPPEARVPDGIPGALVPDAGRNPGGGLGPNPPERDGPGGDAQRDRSHRGDGSVRDRLDDRRDKRKERERDKQRGRARERERRERQQRTQVRDMVRHRGNGADARDLLRGERTRPGEREADRGEEGRGDGGQASTVLSRLIVRLDRSR